MGTGIIKYIRFLIQCVLSVIYDDNDGCVICGQDNGEVGLICCKCREKVRDCSIISEVERDGEVVMFYCSSYYSSAIKELIIRLKYRSDFLCGEALAELMEEVVKRNSLSFDVLAFVPSSKKSLKKRGYNQSEYLARMLGKKTERKVVSCLKKSIETKDQIGLDGESRWENLRNCFNVTDEKLVKDRKILLVDDVMTTGATAFYCARKLMEAGCSEVIVLTAAKSKI